jgi:hypothetical protein
MSPARRSRQGPARAPRPPRGQAGSACRRRPRPPRPGSRRWPPSARPSTASRSAFTSSARRCRAFSVSAWSAAACAAGPSFRPLAGAGQQRQSVGVPRTGGDERLQLGPRSSPSPPARRALSTRSFRDGKVERVEAACRTSSRPRRASQLDRHAPVARWAGTSAAVLWTTCGQRDAPLVGVVKLGSPSSHRGGKLLGWLQGPPGLGFLAERAAKRATPKRFRPSQA